MKTATIFYCSLLLSALLFMPTAQAVEYTYTNSVGMKFVYIPSGDFFMGSCYLSRADKRRDKQREQEGLPPLGAICPANVPIDNDGIDEETPQHAVRISQGFQLGVHEVTLGQFTPFLDSLSDEERDKVDTDKFRKFNDQGADAAVTMVSWDDAQNFISWLMQKERGTLYRLPTEAEWEYAARAGSKTIYPWSDEIDIELAKEYAWFNIKHADVHTQFHKNDDGERENFVHPVGLKKPNTLGFYDMQGNVWEWVQDRYGMYYYHDSPKADPQGPEEGMTRVFRGGSWYGDVKNLRSAYRGVNAQSFRSDSLGFRLVRKHQ